MTARPALLSFHLGPVQPFIEAARTTRDLWAGSYLLSWLAAAAMRPVLERDDTEIVSPFVRDNPLLAAHLRANGHDGLAEKHCPAPVGDSRLPCLPNRFLAIVPDDHRDGLVGQVRRAFDDEWARIRDEVHSRITGPLAALHADWDRLWKAQLDSHFEVRVAAAPAGGLDAKDLDQIGRLLAAVRAVRHVPPYAVPRDADVPQKCTLLGTYEQMGPPRLADSKRFWQDATNPARQPHEPDSVGTPRGITARGAAVRRGERLCAVSLVKRFAWPHHLAPCLGADPGDVRFADTATSAAIEWLQPLPWKKWLSQRRWSGQWLHWRVPNQDRDEDECPGDIWDRIQQHRREHGPPPAYLGIVSVDADDFGQKWRQHPREVSEAVAGFALRRVSEIVEAQHHGELIYTGGDNTLAVCPATRAVGLAHALNRRFAADMAAAVRGRFHLSGGVAVVHFKEDLRFALDQARRAEARSKNTGRDRLTLTVCRRSGEHTTADFGWGVVPAFAALVELFADAGVTDRWAYKLQADMPTLSGVPLAVFEDELWRVVGRADGADRLRPAVEALYQAFLDDRSGGGRTAERFVTLCQSASFLARGRDR
jgi:CRISPR-associated protein Cmr2